MNQKLDYQLLEKILRQTQPELKQMLNSRLKEQGYQTTVECGYLYAPGDVPVLLVAGYCTSPAGTDHLLFRK